MLEKWDTEKGSDLPTHIHFIWFKVIVFKTLDFMSREFPKEYTVLSLWEMCRYGAILQVD